MPDRPPGPRGSRTWWGTPVLRDECGDVVLLRQARLIVAGAVSCTSLPHSIVVQGRKRGRTPAATP
eukprot:2320290-Lingulodinium_polyedra.AAC.1